MFIYVFISPSLTRDLSNSGNSVRDGYIKRIQEKVKRLFDEKGPKFIRQEIEALGHPGVGKNEEIVNKLIELLINLEVNLF